MTRPTREQQAAALERDWAENPRWKGIKRGYSAADVVRLRGSVNIEHTLAKRGAEKLWTLVNTEPFVNTLGALTGNQAMQQVKAGLKAIYLSGWQVAGDANSNGEMYPDQSLYSVDSVPKVVKKINATFARADQIQWSEGKDDIDYFAPIVADAEAGFGGVLNAFELMKAMIEAGAAGVHFEDQLASVKKCGHMGGKVLVPTREAVAKLVAARLAADVMGTPTVLLARTDAEAADLVTSDVDDNDKPFCSGERTVEGFFRTRNGLEQSVSRGLAYAPYVDMLWCETGKPDLAFAKAFADAIHAKFPGKLLAYNCSPSFNWEKKLDAARNDLAAAQRRGEFQRAGELTYGVIPKLESELANILNERRVTTDLGRPWTRGTVHQVLINEKYIGNNVWNRSSFKLKQQHVRNSPETWRRANGAFTPIVDQSLFEAARAIIEERSRRLSNDELLDLLRRLLQENGYLSGLLIDEADTDASSAAYRSRFGSLLRAYQLIGFTPARDYRYIEINRELRRLHPEVLAAVVAGIERSGGTVVTTAASGLLTINDEFTLSLVVARCRQTEAGSLRWHIHLDTGLLPDLTAAVRMDAINKQALDYYLLPRLDMILPRLRLAQDNGMSLDSYRFDTLDALYELTGRIHLLEVA